MARTNYEEKIARLKKQRDDLEREIEKAEKANADELQAICWRAIEPHIISRDVAFRFKKAIENDTIIALLFENKMLPKSISEAIVESEESKIDET